MPPSATFREHSQLLVEEGPEFSLRNSKIAASLFALERRANRMMASATRCYRGPSPSKGGNRHCRVVSVFLKFGKGLSYASPQAPRPDLGMGESVQRG